MAERMSDEEWAGTKALSAWSDYERREVTAELDRARATEATLTAERDAALKAKEEAERAEMTLRELLRRERETLREELRVAKADLADKCRLLLEYAHDGDSLRSQLAQAREALEKMQAEVEDWGHTEDCSRMGECDLAGPCDGSNEPCPTAAPHRWCDYHGHEEECPPCECGKAPMLKMIGAALASLSPPSPGAETKKPENA